MSTSAMAPRLGWIALAALLAVAPAAHPQAVWRGTGPDANWSTPTNWVANAVPPANQSLTFVAAG
jgi:hypothetical protein